MHLEISGQNNLIYEPWLKGGFQLNQQGKQINLDQDGYQKRISINQLRLDMPTQMKQQVNYMKQKRSLEKIVFTLFQLIKLGKNKFSLKYQYKIIGFITKMQEKEEQYVQLLKKNSIILKKLIQLMYPRIQLQSKLDNIFITSCYMPDNNKNENIKDQAYDYSNLLLNQFLNNPHVLMGDFNALLQDYGDNPTNDYDNTNRFQEFLIQNDLEIVNNMNSNTCIQGLCIAMTILQQTIT